MKHGLTVVADIADHLAESELAISEPSRTVNAVDRPGSERKRSGEAGRGPHVVSQPDLARCRSARRHGGRVDGVPAAGVDVGRCQPVGSSAAT